MPVDYSERLATIRKRHSDVPCGPWSKGENATECLLLYHANRMEAEAQRLREDDAIFVGEHEKLVEAREKITALTETVEQLTAQNEVFVGEHEELEAARSQVNSLTETVEQLTAEKEHQELVIARETITGLESQVARVGQERNDLSTRLEESVRTRILLSNSLEEVVEIVNKALGS